MTACAVEECASPVHGRGWCIVHYNRWRRWGNPMAGGPSKEVRVGEAAYVIGEVEWLFSFGIDPLTTASQLGRTLNSLDILCRRNDRSDLANQFQKAIKFERRQAA